MDANLLDYIHSARVGCELSLKCLVLLELVLQVLRISVRLIRCCLKFFSYPSFSLEDKINNAFSTTILA